MREMSSSGVSKGTQCFIRPVAILQGIIPVLLTRSLVEESAGADGERRS